MVVAAALPATVALGLRHLESQRSLLALGKDSPGLSALAKKMRLAPDHHIAILNAPPGYLAQLAPAPPDLYTALKGSTVYDVVQLFVNNIDELRALGPPAIRAVKPDGLLWIAYPKGGATRGATDLPATPWWTKRDVLGELTGVTGYKPVAFVKIDDNWTALRFKKT
ncbi:MAG: hypothetical protein AUG06_01080 [Actinobacteria bacterium 13_1_20CM_2_65_11]|nr:MAG: hypothetical protein AUH40_01465 [Chloroflexi bacterium 13_1_40CM_65_17]OLC65500.1 MAG: hypothetical protein AUH69_09295 [Actinobacteria bacterium 13_1_40CM_4_65_12]OLD23462.1 MAG: hypothetical protein AUJ02_10495 [Chloroflexi bacterium 13_1_40CM_3_65_12]OLD49336.1 MAG: hypothetical protein AUI42_08150 [Actinobacteria bacterium 13_1_40CM_2_65_8]OLE81430.1 MAG: hypothetical protein AUG06_01080 [Actinobacteria bacterium 13_1_20CM_2_65_11]